MGYSFKRIVICHDGTWNNPGTESDRGGGDKVYKPTNVLKTCRAVRTQDDQGVHQLSYYDIGVGALREYPGGWNFVHRVTDNVLGGARGAGFEGNVEDAYRYLVNNYNEGDDVFIFGFSRGASSARSLTRFIDWMGGIVRKSEAYWIPRFFDAFLLADENVTFQSTWDDAYDDTLKIELNKHPGRDRQTNEQNAERILGRYDGKLKMIKPIAIRYLGVWDTVLAMGKKKVKLHIGEYPASVVDNARHAIGIDEKRHDFLPQIWKTTSPKNSGQILEQKWFAGVHSNIGGGYVDDGLANIALSWVLEGATNLGLTLVANFTRFYGAYPYDKLYNSSKAHWVAWEYLTLRGGKGVRKMDPQSIGLDGSKANLSIHRSVFKRLVKDPSEKDKDGTIKHEKLELYRPKNLLDYLVSIENLDKFLQEQIPDAKDEELRTQVIAIVGKHK